MGIMLEITRRPIFVEHYLDACMYPHIYISIYTHRHIYMCMQPHSAWRSIPLWTRFCGHPKYPHKGSNSRFLLDLRKHV